MHVVAEVTGECNFRPHNDVTLCSSLRTGWSRFVSYVCVTTVYVKKVINAGFV